MISIGLVKRLSFSREIDEYDGEGALMTAPNGVIKVWLEFEILRMIDRMDVDPTLALVPVARTCKVAWHAVGMRDWFPYKYKTRNLIFVSESSPRVRKLADGTGEKVAGTDLLRPIYCEEFAKRGMSFAFVKAAWLKYLKKKLDYGIPSLGAQDAFLKRKSRPAVPDRDRGQAPPVASTVAGDVEDDVDWELDGTVGQKDVKRVGKKRHLRDFQYGCREKIAALRKPLLRLSSALPSFHTKREL